MPIEMILAVANAAFALLALIWAAMRHWPRVVALPAPPTRAPLGFAPSA